MWYDTDCNKKLLRRTFKVMKKIIAITIMSLMIFAMAVPMFAAFEQEADLQNVKFEIKKADMEIKFDGDISEFDDMFKIDTKDSWMSYATATDDQMVQAKAMDTPIWMAWDDTYLYVATSYKPATYENTKADDPGNMWQQAAIQMNVSSADAVDTDRLEYGIALTSDTNAMISTVWANRDGYDHQPEGNYFVKNDGGTLIYENRVAWTDFLDAAPKEGDTIGFCIVWAAGTGAEHLHKQLASGCTGDSGKQAGNFAKVTLGAAPERPVEEIIEDVGEAAPAETAPAEKAPTAVQTSDSVVYLAAIAVVSFAAIVVITKKVKAQ